MLAMGLGAVVKIRTLQSFHKTFSCDWSNLLMIYLLVLYMLESAIA